MATFPLQKGRETFRGLTEKSTAICHHMESTANEEGVRFLLLFGHSAAVKTLLGLGEDLPEPCCIVQTSVRRGSFVKPDLSAKESPCLKISVEAYLSLFHFFENIWPERLNRLMMHSKTIQSATLQDWHHLSKQLSALDVAGFVYCYNVDEQTSISCTAVPKTNTVDLQLKLTDGDRVLALPVGATARLFADRTAHEVVSERYNISLAGQKCQ